MSAIQRPKHLIGIGVWLTVIGLWTALYAYANYSKIPICKDATNYALTPAYREIEIELRPDCWSGEVTAHYKIYWGIVDGHTPYQALFQDTFTYEGNGPDSVINETVPYTDPIRFKGIGRMRIALFHFEDSVSLR
jgi:hypothetical protein